jgi:hypothetical protein
MTDEKERVDWSALMDAHGIEPDAETASPAVEPASREEVAEKRRAKRSRLMHVVVAVTALFSIAASAAVLIAITRGGGEGGSGSAPTAKTETPMAPVGPRPAAFEQTSDGVTVVPPEAANPPPAAETPPPAAETPPPAAKKPRGAAESPPPAVAETPPPAAKGPPSGAKKPPPGAESPPRAGGTPPKSADTPQPAAEKPPSASETAAAPDPNLPDEPDKAAVDTAMAALEKDIAACATPAGISGDVSIKMRIEPDGKVAWASAKVQSSPFQACLDRLFKKARMPKSGKGATIRQTVALP